MIFERLVEVHPIDRRQDLDEMTFDPSFTTNLEHLAGVLVARRVLDLAATETPKALTQNAKLGKAFFVRGAHLRSGLLAQNDDLADLCSVCPALGCPLGSFGICFAAHPNSLALGLAEVERR